MAFTTSDATSREIEFWSPVKVLDYKGVQLIGSVGSAAERSHWSMNLLVPGSKFV